MKIEKDITENKHIGWKKIERKIKKTNRQSRKIGLWYLKNKKNLLKIAKLLKDNIIENEG